MNCVFNHVHSKLLWPEWKDFLQTLEPNCCEPLVLLPSCRDVLKHPSCIFCKSHNLIESPESYPDLTEELLKSTKDFIYQGADLDEATFDKILELKEAFNPKAAGEDYCALYSSEDTVPSSSLYSSTAD